jgi:3-dehydroquinate dehydratase
VIPAAVTSLRIRTERERTAPDDVVEWRFDELERAGVEAVQALGLALDASFDVGSLRSLVARGCPAGLAVRIVR